MCNNDDHLEALSLNPMTPSVVEEIRSESDDLPHDLGLARVLAARVAVLAGGRVVESGPVEEVLGRPRHAATRRLVEAVPRGDPRKRA